MYSDRLKKLNHAQCVEFAVFCAEQVLPVFEKEYPDDSRPRAAICAAKKWLENPCDAITDITNAVYAAYAAAYAVHAADDVCVGDDRYDATAAGAAVYAAAYAVYAADSAAYAVYAAAAAADSASYAVNVGTIENYLKELETD